MRKRRIGTAKFFTLLLLLYHTSAKKAELKFYENQYAEFSMGKQSFDFKIPQEVQEAVENLQQ